MGRELAIAMGSNNHGNSKEFLELIKSIGESRSKAEEDRIVLREIETLKRRINNADTPKCNILAVILDSLDCVAGNNVFELLFCGDVHAALGDPLNSEAAGGANVGDAGVRLVDEGLKGVPTRLRVV